MPKKQQEHDWSIPAVESEFQGKSAPAIKAATSAFTYFQSDCFSNDVGADLEFGPRQQLIASQWRELDEAQKSKFTGMAKKDKQRYNDESAARDAEVEADREAKRKEREGPIDGPRVKRAEAAPVVERKKRELTKEEKEEKAARQAAKKEKMDEQNAQMAEVKQNLADKAQKRLQYLLQQSDVFQAFGVSKDGIKTKSGKGDQASEGDGSSSSASEPPPPSPSKRRRSVEDGEDENEAEEQEGDETYLLQQPSCIKFGKMRPYQLEGLNWMIRLQEHGVNGIMADEMGLGKTLQSISILGYTQEFKGISGPHIVLVPKSTLANWMNEFGRWCPSLRAIRFHGDKHERAEIIQERLRPGIKQSERDWDVLVTTYEVANMERTALMKIAWRYLIIDEAHRIKNEQSMFSQTIRALQTEHRLLITGTPLQNNLHELWALLNFLLPDVFESSEQFDELFNLDVDDDSKKKDMIGMLHKILRPFMIRRLKADVEKSLPPKQELILFTGMSAMQRELYKKILRREVDTVNGEAATSKNALLNIVMQLRKACAHPYLFEGVEDRKLDPLGEHLVTNCGKLNLLSKLLIKLKARGHRVLIFSQMTKVLDILEDFMIMREYQYCRIDGDTTYEEREDSIDAYNAPESEKFVFMLSTRAGGLGINLQTADTVILYDSDWNPQADLQAQDRAHRIGQKKVVNVYRLVTENTIEEKVVQRAQQKLKLDAMVVQQGRLQNKDKLSKDELMDALRFGADKVFRAGDDATITDDDIDAILDRGKKKTEEMAAKLEDNDKGDLMDFSMDGGMKAQTFEGTDYSAAARNRQGPVIDKLMLLEEDCSKQRVRKPVTNYSEAVSLNEGGVPRKMKKRSKLPEHMRLPRTHEWQFLNAPRLEELSASEEQLFLKLDPDFYPDDMSTLVVLPEEEAAEKAQLLAEGFLNWGRADYKDFVAASAKHGRDNLTAIAGEIEGMTYEDVRAYHTAFWLKGPVYLHKEWDKNVRKIVWGEKKVADHLRLTEATKTMFERYEDPWRDLSLTYSKTQSGFTQSFTADEDRLLLCLTHTCGFGNWEKVREEFMRLGDGQFDYYLLSATTEAIGRRCESLMRVALNDLADWERKEEEAALREERERKMKEAKLKAETEAKEKRLRELDEQLKTLRKAQEDLERQRTEIKAKDSAERKAGGEGKKSGGGGGGGGDGGGGDGAEGSSSGEGKKSSGGGGSEGDKKKKGIVAKPFPAEYLEPLQTLLLGNPQLGVDKAIVKFLEDHQNVSARQLRMKITEIAVKERRDPEAPAQWYLRTPEEIEAWKIEDAKRAEKEKEKEKAKKAAGKDGSSRPALKGKDGNASVDSLQGEGGGDEGNGKISKSGDKRKLSVDGSKTGSDLTKSGKKKTKVGTPKSGGKAGTPKSGGGGESPKRRRPEEGGGGGGNGGDVAQDPSKKKPKSAYLQFCLQNRAEAKKALPQGFETSALEEELQRRWNSLPDKARSDLELAAKREKAAWNKTMKAWKEQQQQNNREADRTKKMKKSLGSPTAASSALKKGLSSPASGASAFSIPKKGRSLSEDGGDSLAGAPVMGGGTIPKKAKTASGFFGSGSEGGSSNGSAPGMMAIPKKTPTAAP